MTDSETVTVSFDKSDLERFKQVNIPSDIVQEILERHEDYVNDGVQRDAVVSKRKVSMDTGYVFVWGDWE